MADSISALIRHPILIGTPESAEHAEIKERLSNLCVLCLLCG